MNNNMFLKYLKDSSTLTRKLTGLIVLLIFVVSEASATPISIAFNSTRNNVGSVGNANPIGEPNNNLGLQLSGQVGAWESFVVGNGWINSGAAPGNSLVSPSINVGGITFTFDTGAEGYETFNDPNGTDDLRQSVAFLRGNNQSLTWSITGLINNAMYDLVLFGQENGANSALFSIDGYDAGNGVGLAVTNDAEADGNFESVTAVGGSITGRFALPSGQSFAGWSGLQIMQVNEPSMLMFLLLSLVSLFRTKRPFK